VEDLFLNAFCCWKFKQIAKIGELENLKLINVRNDGNISYVRNFARNSYENMIKK
jgi:hypothetical protein